jgi:hypothetical protein
MARYRMKSGGVEYGVQDNRVYHGQDRTYSGPSITLKAFSQGQNPPAPPPLVTTQKPSRPPRPVVETYAPPRTLDLVTQVQQGQPLPPVTPPRPRVQGLVCRTWGCVLCRCPIAPAGGLDAIVAMQRAQGKRP